MPQEQTELPSSWFNSYLVSTIAGLVIGPLLIIKQQPINPIHAGIYIYCTTGLAGGIWGVEWLNRSYGYLGATGMLIWALFLMVTLALFYMYDISKDCYNNIKHIKNVGTLLLVCCLSITISLFNQGHSLLVEMLSFCILFGAQSVLKVSFKSSTLKAPHTTA